jgi:hypothetical protein
MRKNERRDKMEKKYGESGVKWERKVCKGSKAITYFKKPAECVEKEVFKRVFFICRRLLFIYKKKKKKSKVNYQWTLYNYLCFFLLLLKRTCSQKSFPQSSDQQVQPFF